MTPDARALVRFMQGAERAGWLWSVTRLPEGFKVSVFVDGVIHEDCDATLEAAIVRVLDSIADD